MTAGRECLRAGRCIEVWSADERHRIFEAWGRARSRWLRLHGLTDWGVQMILGHATAAVTLSVYAHLWPGDDDRARTILDAALADCVRTEEVVGQ